jgi:tRNA A-37 threonylcarbamoyl transferase component Bud32/CheY-like chemotaxis protein
MAIFDAESLAEQTVLIGLLSRAQMREAKEESEDGSVEALKKSFLRKQMLTSWQLDRLMKGEGTGFFYGGCKVLFHIAEGTFARVYRGAKLPGMQPVAIKVLRQRFLSDALAVERFNQEAAAGLKLIHPNIVRILDYGEQDKRHYMVMEYVEGSNLRDFLRLRHRLSPGEALPLMLGLARGLQHSLDQGVTHRDIKGTNILIGSSGVAKLVDFGLATLRDESSKISAAHGQRTVDYSALERTCGSPKGDPRSDIFFLGCVFYQMLTGQPPMPEAESDDMLQKMLKRSFGAIKPLSEHPHSPPPAMARIIEKMMKVDLRSRYQHLGDAVADLEKYQAVLDAAPVVPKPMRPVRAPAPQIEEDDGAEFSEEGFETKAYSQKNVLCVEVQDHIQEAFRRTLTNMGYRVILVRSSELAAERFAEAPPDVVIFDTDGLGPNALDAFSEMHEKARDEGQEFSALVLLGPRQGALAERLPTDGRIVVLTKPIKMKDVQEALSQLAPTSIP